MGGPISGHFLSNLAALQLSFAAADILQAHSCRMLGIFLGVELTPTFLDICCPAWSRQSFK
jgi:hypothetical protein